ncbi:hypothetical protein P9112_003777 [Eukaryota sp. TZLM1-RC]
MKILTCFRLQVLNKVIHLVDPPNASLVFNRIGKKAKEFFSPFQFGIKTIDGASSAALSSDVFFNSSDSNYIFNLDFKNAFNSVSRSSILPLLQKHFPEVESFFYSFYGKSSTSSYFQNLMCLNYVPPHELTAARLVALVKPGKGDKPDGVRPIAIGESLTRLLSSLIFNRISTKARDYLKPFQFGIKTVEGASVASMTSDVFFQ